MTTLNNARPARAAAPGRDGNPAASGRRAAPPAPPCRRGRCRPPGDGRSPGPGGPRT